MELYVFTYECRVFTTIVITVLKKRSRFLIFMMRFILLAAIADFSAAATVVVKVPSNTDAAFAHVRDAAVISAGDARVVAPAPPAALD